MPYGTHACTFSPLAHLDHVAIEYLSNLLADQGVKPLFPLHVHRRRGVWGMTLPLGVFHGDFRADAVTLEQHVAAHDRLLTEATAVNHGRRAWIHAQDPLVYEDRRYYHPEALRVLANHVDHPAFLRAAYLFLEAATKHPEMVVTKTPRPVIPLAERQAVLGHPARGRCWTEAEDTVLRRWFRQRTIGPQAGRHVRLTEVEWARVLAELPERNRTSVRNRIVELNRRLQAAYFRDGYLARDRLPAYMAEVLGERPRIPLRPRRRRGAARHSSSPVRPA